MSHPRSPWWRRLASLAALAFIAVGGPALAADPVEIRIVIRDHKFEPAQIEVQPGQELKLIVTNADSTPEEFESVGLKIERIIPPAARPNSRCAPSWPTETTNSSGNFIRIRPKARSSSNSRAGSGRHAVDVRLKHLKRKTRLS